MKIYVVIFKDQYDGCEECGVNNHAEIMGAFVSKFDADEYILKHPYYSPEDLRIEIVDLTEDKK